MSTFSDTGSLRMTSGAIQATVPANDILVLLSLSSLEVPKSEIFTRSSCVISMLQRRDDTKCNGELRVGGTSHQSTWVEGAHLLGGLEVSMDDFVKVEVVHATRDAH